MQEVTCHNVSEQRIAQALEGIAGRTMRRWHVLRYADLSLTKLQEMCDELLDHAAARTLEDPTLSAAPSRIVLRTPAECALGVLSLGAFPNGDFEVPLPLIGETLNSEDLSFGDAVDQAPTSRTWLDAFALCLVSGAVRERDRVIGLLLREDYAPAIRDGVPYSPLESRSDPAGLAEMDALCGYLTKARGHLPRDWPSVTLCKPDVEEACGPTRRRWPERGPCSPQGDGHRHHGSRNCRGRTSATGCPPTSAAPWPAALPQPAPPHQRHRTRLRHRHGRDPSLNSVSPATGRRRTSPVP